jgi:hypothetical protein
MRIAAKINKSLSLENSVLKEVERTKGAASTSERVNALLKIALELEQSQQLEHEAEAFFASVPDEDRVSRKAFQSATIRSLARED